MQPCYVHVDMNTLFTVLTPTHNRSKFLLQNINSIQKQKQIGFEHEHIIIDNSSTDDTRELVEAAAKEDPRIKYIYNPKNLGPADALNIGFAEAKGDLIIPLDDDDMLPLSSLQFRHNFFLRNPEVQWAYGHSLFVDEENRLLKDLGEYKVAHEEMGSFFESILKRNFIPNGTVTIRRPCIQAVGGWNVDLATQDLDMWLKLAHKGYKHAYMEAYLTYYRIHADQLSVTHAKEGIFKREGNYYRKLYGKEG